MLVKRVNLVSKVRGGGEDQKLLCSRRKKDERSVPLIAKRMVRISEMKVM